MRFKEISGKEIIDVTSGTRLGILGQTDLLIDRDSGKVTAIVVPAYRWFGMKKAEEETKINWNQIKKIGKDFILVEFPQK